MNLVELPIVNPMSVETLAFKYLGSDGNNIFKALIIELESSAFSLGRVITVESNNEELSGIKGPGKHFLTSFGLFINGRIAMLKRSMRNLCNLA